MARSIQAEYDRRNRSHPHPKYGPYTCPRCEGLFRTSPQFATHMRFHYKSESEEERRVRLEEKNRHCGNHKEPVKAAAEPMAAAFRPIHLSLQTLRTLASVTMSVKTENVGVQEMEMEMEMEMEGDQGPPGFCKIKKEPLM